MRVNTAITRPFTIQNEPKEDVSNFNYLGSITSISGGTEEDIRSRIGKARHVFTTLRPIWKNKNIRLPTKLKLFNSNVISTLLYESDIWRHTKALDEKLKVFVNTWLRQILQIRWPETISNQDLWRTTRQVPITENIKKRKLRWIGHTLRNDPNNNFLIFWLEPTRQEKMMKTWPDMEKNAGQRAQDHILVLQWS